LRWALEEISFIVVLGSVLYFVVFEWSSGAYPIAPIALAAMGILFVLFTFYPPQLLLFRDVVIDGYGIVD